MSAHDLLAEPDKCAECRAITAFDSIGTTAKAEHAFLQDRAIAQAVRAAAQALSPSMNPFIFLQSLEHGTSPAVLCRELDKPMTPVP